MRIFFNLFLLSIGSIFGSVYLNKRYEEMVPITVMTIIFTLFLFYMLNLVLVGYYFIIVIEFFLLILSGIKFLKDKNIRKKAINNFFTPGLLIFAVTALLIYLITKNNFVMNFDELRLWALYPKSIFVSNKLMLGNDLYFSSDYYPGMPLFQYFFAKNAGYFSESHLYLSYSLVILSFLIPITKKVNWKNYWAIIPMIILLFTFPMIFANSGFDNVYYYKSLFVDPALGIAFGYSLFLSTSDLKNDKYKYILFCFSLPMIILMKVVGLILAGCVILSYLFNQLFIYKSYKLKFKKININNFFKLIFPIILLIFTFISWQTVIKLNTNIDKSNETISTSRINDSLELFLSPNENQKNFITSYITYIKDNTIIYNNNSYSSKITIPNISILFLVLMFLMFFSVNKDKRKIILSSSIFSVISILSFLLLYLYIYVFTFNSTILCYGRYISPVISGISVLILLLIFDLSHKIKNLSLYYFILALLIILYFNNMPRVSTFVYEENIEITTNKLENEILLTFGKENKNINLYTIYNYCDSVYYTCVLYQHHLFLSLIDNGIYPLMSGMYLASEGAVPPSFYIPINYNNINLYLDNYDYILIVEDIQNIAIDSKKLFGSNPKAGDIFKKIIDKKGNVKMKKINSFK